MCNSGRRSPRVQMSLSPYFVKQFFSMPLLNRTYAQRRTVVAQLGDRIAFSVQGLFWDQFANTIMGLLQKVGFESMERVRAVPSVKIHGTDYRVFVYSSLTCSFLSCFPVITAATTALWRDPSASPREFTPTYLGARTCVV